MQLGVNCLRGYAVLVDLAKMRLVCKIYFRCIFLNFYAYENHSNLYSCCVWWEFPLWQARFFFQQLISGVSYCHFMVYFELSFTLCVRNLYEPFLNQSFYCSKFVIGIWNWKTRSWMEVQHLGLKYAILVTPRSVIFSFKIINIFSWNSGNCYFLTLFNVSPYAVCFIAFATQINSWNTCIHCSRGFVTKGIWWKGIYHFLPHFLALIESYIEN